MNTPIYSALYHCRYKETVVTLLKLGYSSAASMSPEPLDSAHSTVK